VRAAASAPPPPRGDLRLYRSKAARRHDEWTRADSYAESTVTTYAVKWREPDGQTFVGRLVLDPRGLRLEGRQRGADGLAVRRQFAYEELRGTRNGSQAAGRLDGRPALVVDFSEGSYLVAGAGIGAPIIQELVDRISELVGPQQTCG
jgi:hypothetical protein